MKCPRCKAWGTSVINSRPRGHSVYRRRACSGCGYRFTTHEDYGEDLFDLWAAELVRRGLIEIL